MCNVVETWDILGPTGKLLRIILRIELAKAREPSVECTAWDATLFACHAPLDLAEKERLSRFHFLVGLGHSNLEQGPYVFGR